MQYLPRCQAAAALVLNQNVGSCIRRVVRQRSQITEQIIDVSAYTYHLAIIV